MQAMCASVSFVTRSRNFSASASEYGCGILSRNLSQTLRLFAATANASASSALPGTQDALREFDSHPNTIRRLDEICRAWNGEAVASFERRSTLEIEYTDAPYQRRSDTASVPRSAEGKLETAEGKASDLVAAMLQVIPGLGYVYKGYRDARADRIGRWCFRDFGRRFRRDGHGGFRSRARFRSTGSESCSTSTRFLIASRRKSPTKAKNISV